MEQNNHPNDYIDYSTLDAVISKILNVLLILWCLLPVGMSICTVVMYSTGQLPPVALLEEMGYSLGRFNYSQLIDIYRVAFYALGFLTIVIAINILIIFVQNRANKKSFFASPWFYLLLAFLVWSGVCTLKADSLYTAFWGESYLNDGYFSYLIYAAVFICAASLHRAKDRRRFLRLFSAVISYFAVIMVVQEFDIPYLNECFPSRHAVVFNQFNHFGYMLCMAVMAFWGLYIYDESAGKVRKYLYLVGFAFLSYALMLNDTFGAYLAVWAGLAFVYAVHAGSGRRCAAKQEKIRHFAPLILFALLSGLNIAGLLPFTDALSTNLSQFGTDVVNVAENNVYSATAGTGRMTLWRDTVAKILERPFWGFGPAGFTGFNIITNGDSPHNEYLQITAYEGIPGILLYLGAIITLLIHRIRNLKKLNPMILAVAGCMAGYLFSACFGNPVFNTAPYFWLFYGLTAGTDEEDVPVPSLTRVIGDGSY